VDWLAGAVRQRSVAYPTRHRLAGLAIGRHGWGPQRGAWHPQGYRRSPLPPLAAAESVSKGGQEESEEFDHPRQDRRSSLPPLGPARLLPPYNAWIRGREGRADRYDAEPGRRECLPQQSVPDLHRRVRAIGVGNACLRSTPEPLTPDPGSRPAPAGRPGGGPVGHEYCSCSSQSIPRPSGTRSSRFQSGSIVPTWR
jgi:hypothetical protein